MGYKYNILITFIHIINFLWFQLYLQKENYRERREEKRGHRSPKKSSFLGYNTQMEEEEEETGISFFFNVSIKIKKTKRTNNSLIHGTKSN